jgi:glycerol-3-phosphate cytidylyltransferase
MKIGITFSAFDLLHAGHVLMLEEAKTQCDYLIVGLHVDPSKERPEKNKPTQSVFERYTQLAACRFVDEIIPYETEDDIFTILEHFDVDLRIIGEEYQDLYYTGKDIVPVYYNKRQHNYSSSNLKQKIYEEEKLGAMPDNQERGGEHTESTSKRSGLRGPCLHDGHWFKGQDCPACTKNL